MTGLMRDGYNAKNHLTAEVTYVPTGEHTLTDPELGEILVQSVITRLSRPDFRSEWRITGIETGGRQRNLDGTWRKPRYRFSPQPDAYVLGKAREALEQVSADQPKLS